MSQSMSRNISPGLHVSINGLPICIVLGKLHLRPRLLFRGQSEHVYTRSEDYRDRINVMSNLAPHRPSEQNYDVIVRQVSGR
jgi:hypothetical protein